MKKVINAIKNIRILSAIKWYLLRNFTLAKTAKFNVLGHDMFLDLRTDGISRALAFYGKREEDMLFIIQNILKPGMKVFDLGANMGYYTLEMLRCLDGKGDVLAVEPDPRNLKILKRNIDLAPQRGMLALFEGAVGDNDDEGYVSLVSKSNLTTVSTIAASKNSTKVVIKTIKSLADEFLDGEVNFVRMDIEGFEVEVLTAAADYLGRLNHCNILFECHPNTYNDKHSLVDALDPYFKSGFQVATVVCTEHGKDFFADKDIEASKHIFSDGFDRYFYNDVTAEIACVLAHHQPNAVRYMLLSKS